MMLDKPPIPPATDKSTDPTWVPYKVLPRGLATVPPSHEAMLLFRISRASSIYLLQHVRDLKTPATRSQSLVCSIRKNFQSCVPSDHLWGRLTTSTPLCPSPDEAATSSTPFCSSPEEAATSSTPFCASPEEVPTTSTPFCSSPEEVPASWSHSWPSLSSVDGDFSRSSSDAMLMATGLGEEAVLADATDCRSGDAGTSVPDSFLAGLETPNVS